MKCRSTDCIRPRSRRRTNPSRCLAKSPRGFLPKPTQAARADQHEKQTKNHYLYGDQRGRLYRTESNVPGFKFISESIRTLRRNCVGSGQEHVDDGGGEIIASFLDEGEIDEFNISVVPILIGGRFADSAETPVHSAKPTI